MFWFVSHYLFSWTFYSNQNCKGFPWFDSKPLESRFLWIPPAFAIFPSYDRWLAISPAFSFAVSELLIKTLIMVQRLRWGLIVFFKFGLFCFVVWFFFLIVIIGGQYKMWFLKLNIAGRESTVFGQKAFFSFSHLRPDTLCWGTLAEVLHLYAWNYPTVT